MCSPVKCRTCGKTTWSGCGMHADEVMASVPEDQRCPGHSTPKKKSFSLFGR